MLRLPLEVKMLTLDAAHRQRIDDKRMTICRKHGITEEELLGESTKQIYVAARREYAVYLRDTFEMKTPQIGSLMNKHHTAVLNLLGQTARSKRARSYKRVTESLEAMRSMSSRREILPTRRPHELIDFFYANIEHTLGVGYYDREEGRVAEIFIDTHKNGTALAANAKDGAVVASIAIQHGAPLATIHAALNRAPRFENAPDAGEAAGVVGAALDALKSIRPDLFIAPVCAVRPGEATETHTLAVLRHEHAQALLEVARLQAEAIDPVQYRSALGEADILRAENEALRADVALLKKENEALHDQVAGHADEMEALKGLREIRIDATDLDPAALDAVLDKLREGKPPAFLQPGERIKLQPDHLSPLPGRELRQDRFLDLAVSIWGEAAVLNREERVRRFWEECCEAVQAFGIADGARYAIMQSVFDREPGEPAQEIGGVAMTMLALCAVHGLNAEECEVREFKRVLAKDPNVMRARHQQKVDAGCAIQARLPDSAAAGGH